MFFPLEFRQGWLPHRSCQRNTQGHPAGLSQQVKAWIRVNRWLWPSPIARRVSKLRAMTDTAATADALAAIETSCAERGLSLTPLRKRVLELLLDAGGPVKAYDLLAALKPDGGAQPPTVYRALDFLTKAGLAHKVEALNAYTACSHGDHADQHTHDTAALFICEACGHVDERHVPRVPKEGAPDGFALQRSVIEHYGRCANCA